MILKVEEMAKSEFVKTAASDRNDKMILQRGKDVFICHNQ